MIRRAAPRRGFTLVEILVVIAIIAILASLISVVAVRVQRSAKRTQASAEIAQIGNAIGAYKAKMNIGFIPSGGVKDATNPNGLFRLRKLYTGTEFEAVYLKQLFPQLPGCTGDVKETTGLPDADLDANQTLVFFLTGGDVTKFQGFSTNRANPFKLATTDEEQRIGPFMTFSANRYKTGLQSTGAANASSLLDPWGSPYAYFSFSTIRNKYEDHEFSFNGTTVKPYRDTSPGKKALNPKGFQIISAGENGPDDAPDPRGFGMGDVWEPGKGDYVEGGPGFDDVSNFHEGQLGAK